MSLTMWMRQLITFQPMGFARNSPYWMIAMCTLNGAGIGSRRVYTLRMKRLEKL